MQKIENVENPKVGEYYLVPCIITEIGHVFPIIGHAHKDPEFGITKAHYHHDGRFLARYQSGDVYEGTRFTNAVTEICENSKVEYRKRKMVFEFCGLNHPEKIPSYQNWVQTQIGKEIKNRICPHRGAKMIEIDGKLYCPLHALQGCPKTNKITGGGAIKTDEDLVMDFIANYSEKIIPINTLYKDLKVVRYLGLSKDALQKAISELVKSDKIKASNTIGFYEYVGFNKYGDFLPWYYPKSNKIGGQRYITEITLK